MAANARFYGLSLRINTTTNTEKRRSIDDESLGAPESLPTTPRVDRNASVRELRDSLNNMTNSPTARYALARRDPNPSVSALASRLQEAYDMLRTKDEDLKLASEIGTLLIDKNEEYQVRLSDAQAKIEDQVAEMEKLYAERKEDRMKLKQLQSKHERLVFEHEELLSTVEKLRSSLERESMQRAVVQTNLVKTSGESDEENKRLSDQVQQLQAQLDALTFQNLKACKALEESDDNLATLTEDHNRYKEEAARVKDIETRYNHLFEATKDYNQLKALVADAQWENQQLAKAIRELQYENTRLHEVHEKDSEIFEEMQREVEHMRANDGESRFLSAQNAAAASGHIHGSLTPISTHGPPSRSTSSHTLDPQSVAEVSEAEPEPSVVDGDGEVINRTDTPRASSSNHSLAHSKLEPSRRSLADELIAEHYRLRDGLCVSFEELGTQTDVTWSPESEGFGQLTPIPVAAGDAAANEVINPHQLSREAKMEYFMLTVLTVKINMGSRMDVVCTKSNRELYEQAMKERVQFHQYTDWIERQLMKAYIDTTCRIDPKILSESERTTLAVIDSPRASIRRRPFEHSRDRDSSFPFGSFAAQHNLPQRQPSNGPREVSISNFSAASVSPSPSPPPPGFGNTLVTPTRGPMGGGTPIPFTSPAPSPSATASSSSSPAGSSSAAPSSSSSSTPTPAAANPKRRTLLSVFWSS